MRIAILPTLLAGVAATSVGCLSPRADPSAFYVLTPMEALSNAQSESAAVGVGPVTIPAYLNRSQMVTRVGPNQLDISEYDRWAESLDHGLARTLARNLSLLLGSPNVIVHPWYASDAPDRQVVVNFVRFERDSAGTAILQCSWEMVSTGTGERLGGSDFSVTEPTTEVGTAASVAAMSRALEVLSREIAAALR